jgi:hypothetical protein
MGGIGVAGLLMKLLVWDESAMFFDGSSMGANKSTQLETE